ncbi:hypothetical protein [Methanosphaera sp. WGK6]|uniref:hypothetical protein n=1 Tax=Methanosphaera sp. WGK6 TaxID=1561964 RepID=UPI00084C0991|nr:hypothetical protein [Methanosphaera sp. WGK6]OED29923.1 hypothetical protein NL43_05815 [Methanosphaera sp. WGK6]
MTIKEEIIKHANNKQNILLYQEDLMEIYQTKNQEDHWAYINNPRKGKYALEIIIKTLKPGTITKNKSAAKLLDNIAEITRKTQTIIFIDNFEQVNKRTLEYYEEINTMNVSLVVNIMEDKEFIDETFLKNFIILGGEYNENRSHSINIKYTLLLLLSFLIFLLFIKVQLSIISYLASALWFTLLMYRSFYYMIR